MIPNFKSLFYRLLTSDTNVDIINRVFINKVISSFYEKYEPKIINKIYNTICPINQALDIITFRYRNILGLNEAYLKINCCKVHQRRVSFDGNLSCEVGDLIFVVKYELIMAKTTYCVDQRVTITQLKRGRKNGWEIDCTQFYLMRYWPKFIYENREFDLRLFRLYPDVGSFYCLIDNYEDGINKLYLRGRPRKYRTNSIFDSTFLMERSIGYISISNFKIIYDDPPYENGSVRYNAGFSYGW